MFEATVMHSDEGRTGVSTALFFSTRVLIIFYQAPQIANTC